MKQIIGLLCTCSMVFTSPAMPVLAEEPAMVVSSQIIAGQQSENRAAATNTEGEELDAAKVGEAAETEASVATGGGPQIAAPSAVLMEASTGQVIFEKDADTKRSSASVTKVITLILIFDALESGKIKMTDEMVTSTRAKSMGGSQVFLEEGEVRTVETLIKCIMVASGNDASMAAAEYIAGGEPEFVAMMNERAKGLGMTNTNFEDCCGLTESPIHVTMARDITIMFRELINRYPQIHNYSTIWVENTTHVIKQGTKEFGLSSTNKLLKMATSSMVTGLKVSSASIARYCLSATAKKDGIRLITTVMMTPDYKVRFADAQTTSNYGYADCKLYEDKKKLPLPEIQVKNGVEGTVPLKHDGNFSYLSLNGDGLSAIQKELAPEEMIEAPIEPDMKAGVLKYSLNGKPPGEVPILTDGTVREANFKDYLKKLLNAWWMGGTAAREEARTIPSNQAPAEAVGESDQISKTRPEAKKAS